MVSSILPKSERKNSTLLLWYLKSIVFVRFLGELKTPKIHFEIKWPSVLQTQNMPSRYSRCTSSSDGTIQIFFSFLPFLSEPVWLKIHHLIDYIFNTFSPKVVRCMYFITAQIFQTGFHDLYHTMTNKFIYNGLS